MTPSNMHMAPGQLDSPSASEWCHWVTLRNMGDMTTLCNVLELTMDNEKSTTEPYTRQYIVA